MINNEYKIHEKHDWEKKAFSIAHPRCLLFNKQLNND